MDLAKKDLLLMQGAATAVNVSMPVVDVLVNRAKTAVARGRSDWDWAGLAKGARDDAAL